MVRLAGFGRLDEYAWLDGIGSAQSWLRTGHTRLLFTMMVIMALVTTFMAGPLLSLIDRARRGSLIKA